MHGGHERAVLEPAAGRAPAVRLAQRPAGDAERLLPPQPHRHAAELRGRDAHLLRRWREPSPRLPLRLHPGAVPRLLDRRGGQHHTLLLVSRSGKFHAPFLNIYLLYSTLVKLSSDFHFQKTFTSQNPPLGGDRLSYSLTTHSQ